MIKKFKLMEFFTISEAINSNIESNTVFIIANERSKEDGSVGRYYTVFPSFKSFLRVRDSYVHCHELFIDHVNNNTNISGRLVFDFDIKSEYIPSDFKNQIENTIFEVIDMYMKNVDETKLVFVWSTSKNSKKFSKHLTVKNMYFDNWIVMSKIFYELFCNIWDSKYIWLESKDLIDFQIIKKNASLRMTGSSKIGGNVLKLDDPNHILEDSLIRIYLRKQRNSEQIITKENITDTVFDNILEPLEKNNILRKYNSNDFPKIETQIYTINIYKRAFKLYNKINPNVFKMGKINGNIMTLLRTTPSQCTLSGKKHENENAYLRIISDRDMYNVNFGCYRNCGEKKTVRIGSLSIDNLIIFIDPNFQNRINNINFC